MSHALNTYTQSGLVTFDSGKTGIAQLTMEAAVFKGGKAGAALRDMAPEIALTKAAAGRYRAAAEILAVAFVSQSKAFAKLYGTEPWANKAVFASFLAAMENATPGKNGWTAKQSMARALMSALRSLPALKVEAPAGEVIEAVEAE